uniref:hypothetical protein n=1 Tax=Desulfobacter sp. TaxID=2294 RepID=UPI00257C6860
DEVENELVEYLDQLLEQNKDNPTLFIFASKIDHVKNDNDFAITVVASNSIPVPAKKFKRNWKN